MKSVTLPGGASMPALGLGTWRLGETNAARKAEVAALRTAIGLGYRLFDSAEMYGEGGAESVLGEALRAAFAVGDVTRDEIFVVSKVYPHNASRQGTIAACDRSRARLGLDRIDLYLLHWPGSHPLAGTVDAFEALCAQGRIAHWGVSNFDLDAMRALQRADPDARCAANQVWYSASQRGVEFDLLPWMRERGMPLMAYSPIDQAALAGNDVLEGIARRIGASAAQVALAWVLRGQGVVAIPKAVRADHLRDNLAAADLELDDAALAAVDAAFAPPRRKSALAMI
ncbi:MAG TPA: aldo/keto reductase [Burkholderiaceae bacterium]|nr:aldo/keto reductase [Burkholderiaceae bacterium]